MPLVKTAILSSFKFVLVLLVVVFITPIIVILTFTIVAIIVLLGVYMTNALLSNEFMLILYVACAAGIGLGGLALSKWEDLRILGTLFYTLAYFASVPILDINGLPRPMLLLFMVAALLTFLGTMFGLKYADKQRQKKKRAAIKPKVSGTKVGYLHIGRRADFSGWEWSTIDEDGKNVGYIGVKYLTDSFHPVELVPEDTVLADLVHELYYEQNRLAIIDSKGHIDVVNLNDGTCRYEDMGDSNEAVALILQKLINSGRKVV
jgi:hypothetical protein